MKRTLRATTLASQSSVLHRPGPSCRRVRVIRLVKRQRSLLRSAPDEKSGSLESSKASPPQLKLDSETSEPSHTTPRATINGFDSLPDMPPTSNAVQEPSPVVSTPVKTTGLRRAPLSGGVKTATARYDLPAPQVAVRNLVEQTRDRSSYPEPHVAARNLVEQAQFGHLCTVMSNMHHRRSGYPFGTLVDFASDGGGYPIFCLSPLAIHARNLMEDPRCSLVVQMPGWTGLANARVTIFGDVYRLPTDMQSVAREIFLHKHNTDRKERWVTGNFMYFRMHRIVDIYFVGGFGTVQWIDPGDFHGCSPDAIAMNEPRKTLQALNDTFAQDLRKLCYPGREADDAAFISIDATGADIRVRHGSEFSVERIGFPNKVYTVDEAMVAVKEAVLTSCQTTLWH